MTARPDRNGRLADWDSRLLGGEDAGAVFVIVRLTDLWRSAESLLI